MGEKAIWLNIARVCGRIFTSCRRVKIRPHMTSVTAREVDWKLIHCPEGLVLPDCFSVSLAFVVHAQYETVKDQHVSSLLTSELAERERFNAGGRGRLRACHDSETAEQREEWFRKRRMRARCAAQTVQQRESCLP